MSQNTIQNNQTVSLGDWIGTLILTGIPLVGFIMLLVWAFGDNTKASKKNFARASLILMLVGVVLSIIGTILFGGLMAAMMSTMSTYSY